MREVWPDIIVEEGNLPRNVSTLRKVLCESPEDHQYIVTLPGRGYQFVQPVKEISPAEFLNESHATEVAAAKGVRRRTYAVGAVFLAVLLAALTWLALEPWWRKTGSPRSGGSWPMPNEILGSL
jgi:DNA-binding winged helix-turn-helix (wHTH) protein